MGGVKTLKRVIVDFYRERKGDYVKISQYGKRSHGQAESGSGKYTGRREQL